MRVKYIDFDRGHVKKRVSYQLFSNLASDWLVAQVPANPEPC